MSGDELSHLYFEEPWMRAGNNDNPPNVSEFHLLFLLLFCSYLHFPSFVPQFLLLVHQFMYPLISCTNPSVESLPCLRHSAWSGFHRMVQIFTRWGTTHELLLSECSRNVMFFYSSTPALCLVLKDANMGPATKSSMYRCSRLPIFAWWKLMYLEHIYHEAKYCGVSAAAVSERYFQKQNPPSLPGLWTSWEIRYKTKMVAKIAI